MSNQLQKLYKRIRSIEKALGLDHKPGETGDVKNVHTLKSGGRLDKLDKVPEDRGV